MNSTVIVDFLHILATTVWIGGMFFMKLVLIPAQQAIAPAERGHLMGGIAKRFTIVAWTCTATLLVTGFLKTPSGMLLDTSTGYGALLFAKHAAFAVMIVVGLVITLAVAPRLRALAPAPGSAPSPQFVSASKNLDALSATNTVLGVAVLVLVALL